MWCLLRDSHSLNSIRGFTVNNYKVTLTFTTPDDPRGLIFPLVDSIKDVVKVTSSTYHLVEDRPTNDEHHGGLQNDSTQLEASFKEGT